MEAAVKMPEFRTQSRYVIDDTSKVGEARRAAQTLANFEFNAELAGKVAIAATELANNLLLHAGGGELLDPDTGRRTNRPCVELLAIDRGPRDGRRLALHVGWLLHRRHAGHRTGRGAPTGRRVRHSFRARRGHHRHGAIRRLDATAITAPSASRCRGKSTAATPGTSMTEARRRCSLMVVDGLGHGTFAAEAARACIAAFAARTRRIPAGHPAACRPARCRKPAAARRPCARLAERIADVMRASATSPDTW